MYTCTYSYIVCNILYYYLKHKLQKYKFNYISFFINSNFRYFISPKVPKMCTFKNS